MKIVKGLPVLNGSANIGTTVIKAVAKMYRIGQTMLTLSGLGKSG